MKTFLIVLTLVAMLCVILTAVSCGESTEVTTPSATTASKAPETALPETTQAKVTTTVPVTTTKAPETTTVPVSTKKPDPDMSPVSQVLGIQAALKKKTFSASNGLELPYRIYVPEDYSEDYAYPVVLLLHGAGERGNDNQKQLLHVVRNFFSDVASPFYHAIVIVPQCPENMQWVDTPWANGSYTLANVPISKPMTAVVELLDSVIANYSVNTDRQYVTGLSMGGFGTWDLLMRYPDRFAAAIPYCGAADPSQAENLAKIPIWTFHDTTDTSVPVSGTQAVVKAIQEAGGTLITYTETAKYGHNVWTPGVETPGLAQWLFSQRKDKTE